MKAWAEGGRIPLFVLPAAPGSGKSHLLWTIAARGALPPDGDGSPISRDSEWQRALLECSEEFRQQLDELIGVTVSFNTMADIDVDLEQESSASTLIACRMLHSHFAAAAGKRGQPLPYRDLLKFLMAHQLFGDDLTIERVQQIILADAEAAGRKANGTIILVVDELLKCERLNGKRYASMTAAVLQTLSTSMANAIHVVVSSLTPELSRLTKSGSDRLFVSLYLPQLSPLVKLVPGHLDQSYRKVTVEAVQRLLDDLAYQSVLQDTAGVPRLMEVVYRHAAERWKSFGIQPRRPPTAKPSPAGSGSTCVRTGSTSSR